MRKYPDIRVFFSGDPFLDRIKKPVIYRALYFPCFVGFPPKTCFLVNPSFAKSADMEEHANIWCQLLGIILIRRRLTFSPAAITPSPFSGLLSSLGRICEAWMIFQPLHQWTSVLVLSFLPLLNDVTV